MVFTYPGWPGPDTSTVALILIIDRAFECGSGDHRPIYPTPSASLAVTEMMETPGNGEIWALSM
jgi:hypothetical protein